MSSFVGKNIAQQRKILETIREKGTTSISAQLIDMVFVGSIRSPTVEFLRFCEKNNLYTDYDATSMVHHVSVRPLSPTPHIEVEQISFDDLITKLEKKYANEKPTKKRHGHKR